MEPARLGIKALLLSLGDGCREGNHVMLDLGLNLLNSSDGKAGFVAMASAAAEGIIPSSARIVLAVDSTWSQQTYLCSSVEMRPIAGRV